VICVNALQRQRFEFFPYFNVKYIKLKLISYHETVSRQGGDVIEPWYR
jgi:hypothetical protein